MEFPTEIIPTLSPFLTFQDFLCFSRTAQHIYKKFIKYQNKMGFYVFVLLVLFFSFLLNSTLFLLFDVFFIIIAFYFIFELFSYYY